MTVRIEIDPSTCDGFGFCAEILPESLSLDEWGFPVIARADLSPELLRAARQAVQCCPRRALVLRASDLARS
jgi:ferredoxin